MALDNVTIRKWLIYSCQPHSDGIYPIDIVVGTEVDATRACLAWRERFNYTNIYRDNLLEKLIDRVSTCPYHITHHA